MTADARHRGRVNARQIPVHIDRSSPVPLHHQLSEQLERAIHEGILRPGDPFEPELALAERLSMSRPTVRRSIEDLVTRGLLVRRRGSGTTVTKGIVHRSQQALTSHYADLDAAGLRPTTRVLRLDRALCDPVAADALGLPADRPLVCVERLRLADERPVALLKNWLPPEQADLPLAALESAGLYEILEERGCSPVVAHQSIGSRAARRLLNNPPACPPV